jgi:aryl-alcohol dehydrogenase-like predicted oxidoreductase
VNTPESREFLRAAVEAGVGMIDTAHLYTDGESERAIGEALSPYREGVVVATKGGYHKGTTLEQLRAQIEQSFESLRTEKITLYYLHRHHPGLPLEDSLGLIAEYRDQGRIEHVGISEVGIEEIERAREIVPIAAVQNEYNLVARAWDPVIDYCAREGIVFVPFRPLRRNESTALDEIARAHDATPRQIALAWLLRRSPAMLPIPGTRKLDHLRENLGALEIELSDEEFERLSG